MKNDDDGPFRPIRTVPKKKPTVRRQAEKWVPSKSIPEDAKAPPVAHYKHGKPSVVYEYGSADGGLAGYVCRFDIERGDKIFCPLTWCHNEAAGRWDWRWKSWEVPRPLYGLHGLSLRPDAPVVVSEGEKAADAARELLPGYVAVTSPNGSRSARKADWTPLSGRVVVIWPDADEAGQVYAKDVVNSLRNANVERIAVVSPPNQKIEGWDAADALDEGWTTGQALELLRSSSDAVEHGSFTQDDAEEAQSSGRRGVRLRNSLLELLEDCELWHDQERRAFVTVTTNNHSENMRLESREFGIWFSGAAHKHLNEPVGEHAMRDTLRVLEARAIHDGPEYKTFVRIGGKDGKIYLDLGDSNWTIILVDQFGWRVAEMCDLKPIRAAHMQALPVPESGELLEVCFRPLLNVANERDFRLVVAWLVSAFRDVGEYPILSINGEQGSAKSTVARMVRQLIDPNKAANRAAPRDERDLVVAARNSRVISLDNLSGLPAWLSDALCRIATGGGFSARALHTDMDEIVIDLENPIILNGIPEECHRDRRSRLEVAGSVGDVTFCQRNVTNFDIDRSA